MSHKLGPVEICCDAPPYIIVQACRHIRIHSPEDVRWLRMSAFRTWQESRSLRSFFLFWNLLWSRGERAGTTCTCGEELPEVKLVVFTFNTGEKASYLIGQCRRCRTVFWDET